MLLDMLSKLILGPLELLFDVVYAVGYRITANPGLSIVLLSLVINFLVLPLYRRADAVQEEERLQAQRLLRMVFAQANEVALKTMPTMPSSMLVAFTPFAKLRIMVTTDRMIAMIEST